MQTLSNRLGSNQWVLAAREGSYTTKELSLKVYFFLKTVFGEKVI